MNIYPYKFEPIYKEKIWGGRNLQRLFARNLPEDKKIGESWELADLREGVSVVANGPLRGCSLTELTAELGGKLLGKAEAMPDGRFPLLLKLLDANDILSLQVHPDAAAVAEIGGDAALKTECWYIIESRDGYIYKGLRGGASPKQFVGAVKKDNIKDFVRRLDVAAGDFHYLPAGLVHAIGSGVVLAEVQTPSDTTYRVTDWGRGRQIHVDMSLRCIRYGLTGEEPHGQSGQRLLITDYFTVYRREIEAGVGNKFLPGICTAVMMLCGEMQISHAGDAEQTVNVAAGDTVLLPADLIGAEARSRGGGCYLEITLPEKR